MNSIIRPAQCFEKSILFTITVFIIAVSQTLAQSPKAVVAEPGIDAGSVFRGDKITHEFLIKNEGNSPLVISEVKPGCSCTATDYDKTIAPGKTGKVKVIVDPSSFNGPINKLVMVTTNDAANPQLELSVKATIFSYITAKPGFARYSILQDDDHINESKQVITSSDGTSFDITGAESDIPNTKITYHEAGADERLPGITGKQWVVLIVLPNDVPVGPLNSNVHIKTNHAREKQIDIHVTGVVRPILGITPSSVDLGSIESTGVIRQTINVRNFATNPVNVTSVESTIKGIEAKLDPMNPGREYIIRFSVNAAISHGAMNGKVIIHTDSNKKPVIEVPVKGTVL